MMSTSESAYVEISVNVWGCVKHNWKLDSVDTKPLYEQLVGHCWLDTEEQTSVKFEIKSL